MPSSMNIESSLEEGTTIQNGKNKLAPTSEANEKKPMNWPLLLLNCGFMAIGAIGGPLLSRLYFIHGGSRKWVSTMTQTVGCPILFIPLFFLYSRHRSNPQSPPHFFIEPKLFFFSAIIGVLLGIDNFLYALGLSYLPVSTSSMLLATQLSFVAVFSRIIVRQKFTPFSINSVVLMSLGSVLLGLRGDGDRPPGVTGKEYLIGFLLTLGSAALLGFLWPCIELCYAKATRVLNYDAVLQFQLNLSMFASITCFIAMLINKDLKAMERESREYGLGQTMYVVVLVCGSVIWQFTFVGALGLIFCVGSLFNGIFTSVLLPLTEVAAVIIYHEKFTGEKGMALALCLWGFTSYFYGEYQNNKKAKAAALSLKEHDHYNY
ncbi:hypothetical protein Syun_003245 [Stephania yunnanensis]|uniref:Probable purine permease n=1 Tax=Stephania yunnanensis TaxID=152371 RepID=A0AAP0L0U6_9MAGN